MHFSVSSKLQRRLHKRKNKKIFLDYLATTGQVGRFGETWVWSAIDPESKYLLPDVVGQRIRCEGKTLMRMISQHRSNSDDPLLIQTDGFELYPSLIREFFSTRVTFWHYRNAGERAATNADMPETLLYTMLRKKRDTAGHLVSLDTRIVFGEESAIRKILDAHSPGQSINTSYIERSNLNRRHFNARLRRRTMAFSKAYYALVAQLALQRVYANFCWPHHTLTKSNRRPTSPAMAIGKTNRIWSFRDIFFYPLAC